MQLENLQRSLAQNLSCFTETIAENRNIIFYYMGIERIFSNLINVFLQKYDTEDNSKM